MNYDIFISYARRDNTGNQVGSLVDQIAARFATFAGRPLRPFFDTREIEGGEYWQDKILAGLKESRLMLACLSPGYLASQWCEWEFIEYQKYELGRAYLGKGIAPIYFVTVPGFDQPDFEATCTKWVADLRRRHHHDLRPWYGEGEAALEQLDVKERLDAISRQVWEQIRLGEQVEQRKGNLDRANEHFVGRNTEMQRLNRMVSLGRMGVLTAVNGLGGIGKTALALQYAHAYGHLFAGGCWQIRCEGKANLKEAFASLRDQRDMDFELNDEEKKSPDLQFERILRELKQRADAARLEAAASPDRNQKVGRGRVLVLLDNVDQPELLADEQTRCLPRADWLCLLATTRLGTKQLADLAADSFLSIDELPPDDALSLIEIHQPGRAFANETERQAAREIVKLLGGMPLAVESAAVYLGEYQDISCSDYLAGLREEGLVFLDETGEESAKKVRHGEKRLTATLKPTLDRLAEEDRLALAFASLLPADHVPLPWLRHLVAQRFPAYGKDAKPGRRDPWADLARRLLSLCLLQETGVATDRGFPLVVRMHRLLGELVRNTLDNEVQQEYRDTVQTLVVARAESLWEDWVDRANRWEIPPLAALAGYWLDTGLAIGADLANALISPLSGLAHFAEARALMLKAIAIEEKVFPHDHPTLATSYSNLATVEQALGNLNEARALMRKAIAINEKVFPYDHPTLARDYSNLAMMEQD
ncbi:tetratricopeptide repeat protein, partial [Desulfobulbus sp.]|uniref:tetratricopeptide repeat protein n=1 Tax=Desulfobulbus sp. TaxID=895 RepID=UPI00286F16D7